MNVSALSMRAPPRALDDAIDVGLLEAERRSAHGLILRTPAGEELSPGLASRRETIPTGGFGQ